jgi:hypothetical protein
MNVKAQVFQPIMLQYPDLLEQLKRINISINIRNNLLKNSDNLNKQYENDLKKEINALLLDQKNVQNKIKQIYKFN